MNTHLAPSVKLNGKNSPTVAHSGNYTVSQTRSPAVATI